MKRCMLIAVVVCTIVGVVSAERAPLLREPDWSRVDGVRPPPELRARAAILVDVTGTTVLYAKNADLAIPPASLTKLVTIDAVLDLIARGELSASERFTPPEASWAENQPPRSSLMFLGRGQSVTLREILLGLAVSSGNDAAVGVAYLVDGGVDAFADRMNSRMRDLGLIDPFFVEPSGLSDRNSITARSFARFLLAHLERFPWVVDELYSVREYTYPTPNNTGAAGEGVAITQFNRNLLLWADIGVDGFKTGYIDASGYNLAVTAERGGRRLVAVLLGVDAPDAVTGSRIRSEEATRLLEYGFDAFEQLRFGFPAPELVRVYGGSERYAEPRAEGTIELSVPVGRIGGLHGRTTQFTAVNAPIGETVIGSISVSLGDLVLAEIPVTLPAQQRGSLIRRLVDAILRGLDRLFRGVEVMLAR